MTTTVFYKKREELIVAQLLNGMMVIGSFNEEKNCIDEPIAFQARPEYNDYDQNTGQGIGDPIGMNFIPQLVGDGIIKQKEVFIEGQPDIRKFHFTPISLDICITHNMINDIKVGPQLHTFYNNIMTTVTPDKKKDNEVEKKKSKLIGIDK